MPGQDRRLPGSHFSHIGLAALVLLAGCAFQSAYDPAPGAPKLQPSAMTVAVAEAPKGAIALGTVTVQGNNYKGGSECEAQAIFEAKKIGATHVIVRPADSSLGRGVRCTGEAFYLAPSGGL